MEPSMVTTLPEPATIPRPSYLNSEYGLKSWLLIQDDKRIALLYLFTTTFFFMIGGVAASLIRLELLTPAGDLVTRIPTTSFSPFTASSSCSSFSYQ
jgi:cytochrome c oxidase subunit I